MLKTYDPIEMTRPMREELTRAGFEELRTPEEVDKILSAKSGSVLVFVNSVCGCAAGSARPGVVAAVQGLASPPRLTTVFAGQDREATERARGYFPAFPPSSPSVILLKDGAPVYILERRQIEGRTPDFVTAELRRVLGS